jgi:(2Fe-2S) ferredoxin
VSARKETASGAARTVLVCQNKTCRKQGAGDVLAELQAHPLPAVEVVGSRCLGQCGNGAMVLVLPDQVWYHRVRRDEVAAIVKQHLQEGKPIQAMLYRKFHPQPK